MPQIVTVNVTQQVASVPSQLQKTGALISQAGTTTTSGTVTFLASLADLADIINTGGPADELQAMANTFFAQGNTLGVYVLELGSGTDAENVAQLEEYIANPEVRFYSYLVPAAWDVEATFPVLAQNNSSPTSQIYFFVSTAIADDSYVQYEGIKSVFAVVSDPLTPSTQFPTAAFFHATLAYAPSAASLVSPLSWTYVYGLSAYALTNSQQTTLLAAGVNWVGTGAEGGISNTLIVGGQLMDLNPWNYWYAVDWLSINVEQSLAAAVINGSNTPTNPLYYNQAGINRLQAVAQNTANNGVSFGMILSPVEVTATSFVEYVDQNPGDYAIGRYAGLACTFVPARGFQTIVINLTASNIPV
jgi:hypothetical protein